MLWMINCVDKADSDALRAEHLPEHRRYLESVADRIFFSGPHLDDTGQRMIGSVFIIDAPSRKDAQAFIDGETLMQAGVFANVSVTRIRKGRLSPALADAG